MTIAVGEKLPDVTLRVPSPDGPKPVQTTEALGTGRVVLFGVPGAFTPTCSDYHLPGYVLRAEDLTSKGVDTIACTAVNDVFVMGAWAADREVGDKVLMLADGSGDFAKALGLELDLSGVGLGVRSRRYAMVLQDGVVTDLFLEEGPGLDVSSADAVLAKL
ncbi:MAG: peroxiredoxin [Acidimicrobiaceae bacterium]|nr:peroxiredoxin [Acidimicrobiaceae bacterium]